MTLGDLKQLQDQGKTVKLTGLTAAVFDFLQEKKDLDSVVEEFSEDFNEQEAMELFGVETEELMVRLTIESANFFMANWLLNNSEVSDFNKEELAHAFTNEYDLNVQEDGHDLFLSLYKQGFLTPKEIQKILPQLNQETLVELAIMESGDKQLSVIKQLDRLHVSILLQDIRLGKINGEIYEYLKGQQFLVGKNAVSALTKTVVSEGEKKWLVEQALVDNDPEISYYLLTQVELSSLLLSQVIKQALKSLFFNFTSLPTRILTEVEEYIITHRLYKIEQVGDQKQMTYGGRVLAEKKSSGEVVVNKYFNPEVQQLVKQELSAVPVELPEVIKGHYNLKDDEFIPNDKSLSLTGINYKLVVDSDNALQEALKLWRPKVLLPALLVQEKDKTYSLKIKPQESEEYQLYQAENMAELRAKIKQRISLIESQLTLPPINKNRPFGVEIEIVMKGIRPSDVALALEAENLHDHDTLFQTINSTNQSNINRYWVIKADESIKIFNEQGQPLKEHERQQGNFYTAEIITPKLYGEEGLQELRDKLNSLLVEYGDFLTINVSCGLHVHHDMREFLDQRLSVEHMLQEELAKVQESIYSFCAPHRRNNIYCPRLVIKNGVHPPKIVTLKNQEHNLPRPGFNMFTGHGTFEFRMHEATLNVEEIVQWVKITHYLVDQVINKVIASKQGSINNLKETLKLLEIAKLKKIETMEDVELALLEINEFIKNNYWSNILIND